MNKTHGAVFRQSLYDFPCPVTLGKYTPSFGLHRYKQGLRFIPPDDEGFTMRGDKRRLLYKGRRRSHRFTILGDTAFEYDCILEREPVSNVIPLRMEGSESFDFFRQPDFVEEPFLKGSYAVYKKETLVGEGTGKLCHIHRPEIIDARGRRCWGDLAVIGNELRITIPEKWLAEAKYPVIVDPTIGTTTIGSQYKWEQDPGEPLIQLMFEGDIPVNRYLLPDTINGTCTAYMYAYTDHYYENGGYPVLYSDNGNKPLTKRSINQGFADFTVNKSKPAGWRSATFMTISAISSGTYIWFGVFVDFFWEPRFDYGSKCYSDIWYELGNSIPSTYPINNVNWYNDFKLSMYFGYTAYTGQNYVRTLTQGVTLPDNQKITGNYKRTIAQTVQTNATATKQLTIFKRIQETLNSFDLVSEMLSVFTRIHETLNNFDVTKKMFLYFCNIRETLNINDTLSHLRILYRGLKETAGVKSKAKTGFFHFRTISETANVMSSVIREMLLLVRIVTGVFIREFLISRFLKSKTEVALKSCILREIVLESKIN